MNKLEKLQSVLKLLQQDTVRPEDIRKFVERVTQVIAQHKNEFDKLSRDKLKILEDSIAFIEKNYKGAIDNANQALAEIRAIKVKNGKDGRDGIDGRDGTDGLDGSPDTPAQVRDKLETLKDDERLDKSAIKGLERIISQPDLDRAISILDQRTQYLINKVTPTTSSSSGTDVTLAGEDYLSITNQVITANPIDLDNLSATGTPSASTFLRGDNTWATPAGSGDVSKVGTPVDGQIGVWTGDGTIEGDAALTFDTTTDSLIIAASGNLLFGAVTVLDDAAGTMTLSNIDALDATTEATIEAAIDTLANLTSIQGRTITLADAGANAIFGWDDVAGAYENLTAVEALAATGVTASAAEVNILDGATLTTTELNYVDGVTSAIQTQLDTKQSSTLARISGSTYSSVQHLMNFSLGTGRSSGGAVTASATANAVDVAAGTGFIRATDSDVAELLFFNWSAETAVSVPSNTTRYIGIQYNAGAPNVVAKTTDSWDYDTEFPLAVAVNEGGTRYISNIPWQTADNWANMIERIDSMAPVIRDERSGGLIVSNSGTRNVAVTAGSLLSRMEEFSISAIDTATAGSFDTYHRAAVSGFTKTSTQTQWNNTQYDDGSGTLATLTALSYTSRWWYLMTDGSLAMMYGQSQDLDLADIINEAPPTNVPDRIGKMGILIGRFIIRASGTTPERTQTAFGTAFSSANVVDHGSLAGLADDDHTQYLLVDGTRVMTGTLAMGANSITMTGSLAVTGSRVTKGWFTDLESTNMPTVGGTSLSAVTETLTNKTLTDPKIDDIYDPVTGHRVLEFVGTQEGTGGVAYLSLIEDGFSNPPNINFFASGSASNIDLILTPKGTGIVKGELKRFMVRLLASDTATATGTTIGGDFRIANRAITVKAVGAYVDTAGTTNTTTIDINEAGTTILSTKITIDSAEKSSTTAATAAVISDTAIAADAIVTFDVDAISTTPASGLTVWVDYVYA